VRVRFIGRLSDLGRPAAIILPGTKTTLADLAWLRETGLAKEVQAFAEHGGAVVGLCGGYQMLGQGLHDPQGVEALPESSIEGLGLLP
jgi:adenosylcobyric acid synthase